MLIERIITYSLIVGLCIGIGVLTHSKLQLEADLKKARENQDKILTFCKENEKTQNKIKKALEENQSGVEGFNKALDILFEGRK